MFEWLDVNLILAQLKKKHMQLRTLLKMNPLKALVNPVQTGPLKDAPTLVSGSPRRKLVILKEEAIVAFFSHTCGRNS